MGVNNESAVLAHRAGALVEKFPGGAKLADSVEMLVAWARANSLWPLVYGTACCAMEMMSAGSSRHDWARFGVEVARATPRQAEIVDMVRALPTRHDARRSPPVREVTSVRPRGRGHP